MSGLTFNKALLNRIESTSNQIFRELPSTTLHTRNTIQIQRADGIRPLTTM